MHGTRCDSIGSVEPLWIAASGPWLDVGRDEQPFARQRARCELTEGALVSVVVEYLACEAMLSEPDLLFGDPERLIVIGRQLLRPEPGCENLHCFGEGAARQAVLPQQFRDVCRVLLENVRQLIRADAHLPGREHNTFVERSEVNRVFSHAFVERHVAGCAIRP